MHKIILASNSKVRKKILDENGIKSKVFASNVNEELVKEVTILSGPFVRMHGNL